MKITLEDVENEEMEVIIKGNLADERVQTLVTILKGTTLTSKVILFDQTKEVLTRINDILYFEVVDRKIIAATSKSKFICKHTLAEVMELFAKQGIAQIGKSVLVNINHVEALEAEFSGNYIVILDDGTKIIASRFYMKEFRKRIMEA